MHDSAATSDDDDRRAVDAVSRAARTDAPADLAALHERARHAGRSEVRLLIRTARRSDRSTHARYDAAARVLREWYLDVYDAALHRRIGGSPAPTPGVAEVEATAARVGRIRTGDSPQAPLRAAALIWRLAQADADQASLGVLRALRQTLPDRAAAAVTQGRPATPPDDELRGAILRHWYQRCYLAAVEARLGLLPPLRSVTDAEAREVAASITSGQARRLIGADGIPLVTAHGTQTTEADRRLAAGDSGIVPAPSQSGPTQRPHRLLRHLVIKSWTSSSSKTRQAWATATGLSPHQAVGLPPWPDLPGDLQSRLIGHWLDQHRGQFARPADDPATYPPFEGARHRLRGPAEQAAARMFAHTPHPPRAG